MSRAIHCIIVEDEPYAQEILQDYIAMLPDLNLDGIAATPDEILQLIMSHQSHLVLLDLSVARELKPEDANRWPIGTNAPIVVVTTAHQYYDLSNMPFSVTAFLRKPIQFNEFMVAINIVRKKLSSTDHAETDV